MSVPNKNLCADGFSGPDLFLFLMYTSNFGFQLGS